MAGGYPTFGCGSVNEPLPRVTNLPGDEDFHRGKLIDFTTVTPLSGEGAAQ
jgi:hypothetical protein